MPPNVNKCKKMLFFFFFSIFNTRHNRMSLSHYLSTNIRLSWISILFYLTNKKGTAVLQFYKLVLNFLHSTNVRSLFCVCFPFLCSENIRSKYSHCPPELALGNFLNSSEWEKTTFKITSDSHPRHHFTLFCNISVSIIWLYVQLQWNRMKYKITTYMQCMGCVCVLKFGIFYFITVSQFLSSTVYIQL